MDILLHVPDGNINCHRSQKTGSNVNGVNLNTNIANCSGVRIWPLDL